MQVKSLHIAKQESYQQEPGQFRGVLKLEGNGSSQEIRISARCISRIFQILREDAASEALRMASATPAALEDAEHAPLLIEQGNL